MIKHIIVLSVSVLLLGGCNFFNSTKEEVPVATTQALKADAKLADTQGKSLGDIELTEVPDGILISLNLENVSAGEHGIHIHTVGKCEGPSFESAGAHFNPTSKQHGHNNPKGYHLGDLPNIVADENGDVDLEFTVAGITLKKDSPNSLFDADGSSFVIHEKADDYVTDPAGNSGARIACGVIVPNLD